MPPGLLEWSAEAAFFLAELAERADLPEEIRQEAKDLASSFYRALPRE